MPASGSTRWKIAFRQISTTSNLSRFASRRSGPNLSMTQKQIAPTTIILRAPIKAEIIARISFHHLGRQHSVDGQGARRPNWLGGGSEGWLQRPHRRRGMPASESRQELGLI